MTRKYWLKPPKKPGHAFVLVCYTPINRTKKTYHSLAPKLAKQVAAINAQFLSGAIETHQAEAAFRDLIAAQSRGTQVRGAALRESVLSAANQKLFNQYWSEVYEPKELADPSSMRYDLLRAIKLIEPCSLISATPAEFKQALKRNCKSVNQHRRAVDRLNQLMTWLERDVRLTKPEEVLKQPEHLTWAELQTVLPKLGDPTLQDLATTLFGTGLRLGEAMALQPADIRDGYISITKQLAPKRNGNDAQLKKPKRKKVGDVVVLPECLPAVKRWAGVADKMPYRESLQNRLLLACTETWPNNALKRVGPKELRHSHAIHLVSTGISLTMVALQLRNRLEVCQKYYAGFQHSTESTSFLLNLLGKKKPPDPKA